MQTSEFQGLILKEEISGESSKKITLLAKDYGKIYLYAKGARKMNSDLFAVTNVFTYVELIACKKNSTYFVNQGDIIKNFHNISIDVFKLSEAVYISQLVERTALEDNEQNEILKLLYIALGKLEKGNLEPQLITRIFEVKFLQIMGFLPEINCIHCGDIEGLAFTKYNGEFCCGKHSKGEDKIILNQAVYKAMEFIMKKPLAEIFNFQLDLLPYSQLNWITKRYIKIHLDLDLKSREFSSNL